MHKDNKKTQCNCIVCYSPLLKEISLMHLLHRYTICLSCMKQFEIIDKTISFYHHPLRILYFYNDFFKSLLYQYKGVYDYALKDAFLDLFINELKYKYKDYIIIVAPSSYEDNQKRGFAPVECIFKRVNDNIFTGLYKKSSYKQSELNFIERSFVKNKIGIENGEVLKDKKVLIVDDVLTSGSTLYACLNLVLSYHPKRVELLVLSTRRNINDLRFD